MHNLVVNMGSREPVLGYIAKMLTLNEKRCKMRVDERTVAGDGFMLNLLTILQELSVKVINIICFKFLCALLKIIIFRSKWIKLTLYIFSTLKNHLLIYHLIQD